MLALTVVICSICGASSFTDHAILWDKLAAQWRLSPLERAYIDRQQGTSCQRCGANLRSIALANAIRSAIGTTRTLHEFFASEESIPLAILEINEAGSLHNVLQQLPGHRFASYPEVDMHALPYPDNEFDMVIHSDTLEHVAQPLRALSECRRVLRFGGWLCFTVPTIIGRMTGSRSGLEASFHGTSLTTQHDYLVHTEFGADMWTYVLQAGFYEVTVNAVDFPAALALSARKI